MRTFSVCVLVGMFVLAAKLWYVQIVSSKRFERNVQNQTYRTVRVPAIRGKILDRNGLALAANQPRYNLDVYLEELLATYNRTNTMRDDYKRAWHLTRLKTNDLANIEALRQWARYGIVSNVAWQACARLNRPFSLQPEIFFKHLSRLTYVPMTIVTNLSDRDLAIYSEQLANITSMDLDTHPYRNYPLGSASAHLIGYVRSQDWPEDDIPIDPDAYAVPPKLSYCIPFWKGTFGLESEFDETLRGKPGLKRILVNNFSYRQGEEMKVPCEVGGDLVLTIDSRIQRVAAKALSEVFPVTRGAAVVMDPRNGDILALVSAPSFDPELFTGRLTHEQVQKYVLDEQTKPMFNRALGKYNPGSTFKIITAIACLEKGLDPDEVCACNGEYPLGSRSGIGDTAPPGQYNFEEAFYRSSNFYFISNAVHWAGQRKLLEVGRRFHLGESSGIDIGHESDGDFPTPDQAADTWIPSDLCFAAIGQKITTSPVQMAGVIAAIANGGKMYYPRVLSQLKSPENGTERVLTEPGHLRDTIAIQPRHLEIIRHAMLMDTENPHASAYEAFYTPSHEPRSSILAGAHFRVAGKTGTAQLANKRDHTTWFVSYGPYESPRYVVVVVVESGASGGKTCAPVAEKIYDALVRCELAGHASYESYKSHDAIALN